MTSSADGESYMGSPLINRIVSKSARAQNPIKTFLKIKNRKKTINGVTESSLLFCRTAMF